MNTPIATAAPTYHALTGTQPVGHTQIATMVEYAGTITTVRRNNTTYWTVTTRETRDAFRQYDGGMSCAIWFDPTERRYVVDYWSVGASVEADRTRTLRAAIGVAATVTAQRWLRQRVDHGQVR